MKMTTNKTNKKSTGVYLDVEMIESIKALAKKNGMSTNETMAQLLTISLEEVGEANNA